MIHEFVRADTFDADWHKLGRLDRREVKDLVGYIDKYPLQGREFQEVDGKMWYACLSPDLSLAVVYRLERNVIYLKNIYLSEPQSDEG